MSLVCRSGLTLFLSLPLVAGCTDDSRGGDTTGESGETGPEDVEEPCLSCEEHAWSCSCTFIDNQVAFLEYFCWDVEEWEADGECDKDCRYGNPFTKSGDATPVACAAPNPQRCESWHPTKEISYDDAAGVYKLDHSFIAGLAQDPAPLWTCDDAVISALATGGFEVRRAKPDDLLYELGLRSGDRILSLNGYMLDSYDDAEVAFTSLWSSLAETTYTLELLRGRDVRELNYEIIQLRQPPESIVE